MNGKYCELVLKPRENDATEIPSELSALFTYLEFQSVQKSMCLESKLPERVALYNDLVEDVEDLSGEDRERNKRQRSYFCISNMSSTYKTQSTASQANPMFRFTFSDKSDKRINLIEFSTESEYWLFCREVKRQLSGIAGSAEGLCFFTAKSGPTGTANRWVLAESALKIIDSKNGLTYYSLIEDIRNPQFIFDYSLPKKNLHLDIKMDSKEEYFSLKALITFENTSLDASNPVETVVSIGKEKSIVVPMYLNDVGVPKMRIKVVENIDKIAATGKETSGIFQNFGESTIAFGDTIAPTLLIARNASREQNQFTDILIKPPQDSKRSLQILIHSASTRTQVRSKFHATNLLLIICMKYTVNYRNRVR
jgi:hypothetical protein